MKDWIDCAGYYCYNPIQKSPIRLEAQDVALSRLKQGFESPMGHKSTPTFIVGVDFLKLLHDK